MTAPTLFDTPEAARDSGIASVSRNNQTYLKEARKLIPQYPHSEVTGEELREFIEARLGPMSHHNLTGAIVLGAVRAGILVNSGVYRRMKKVNSHSRVGPVYTINR
jgi:hypothetical protein